MVQLQHSFSVKRSIKWLHSFTHLTIHFPNSSDWLLVFSTQVLRQYFTGDVRYSTTAFEYNVFKASIAYPYSLVQLDSSLHTWLTSRPSPVSSPSSSSVSNPMSVAMGTNLNVNTAAQGPSSPSQQQIREVVALPLANIYRVQLPLDIIPGGMQPVDTPRGRRILVKIPEDAVIMHISFRFASRVCF